MASTVEIEIVGTDSFSGVLGNFGNIMTGIKSAIDLAGDAFRTFTGFAMEGLDAIASYERIGASLESLVAAQLVMNGAAEDMASAYEIAGVKAEELLGWIQEVAINSPFTQEGVALAFRQAMAYGFSAEEAKRLTQALIDFAAASGAPESAMQSIALALGQIEAKGKLSGQEILQLVNNGLPVLQILADHFGVTTAEIQKMVEKGLVPADEAIRAITEYIEGNFAGAAERQATTWAGLMGTFEDLKAMGLREFFGSLFEVLQPLAIELSEWLQGPGLEKIKEWGTQLGIFAEIVVTAGQALATGKLWELGALLQSLGDYESDNIFFALGTAIRTFQQALEDGLPAWDALEKAIGKFTDLSGIDTDALIKGADTFVANIFNKIGKEIDLWMVTDGPEKLSAKLIAWIDSIGDGPDVGSKMATAAGKLFAALDEAVSRIDWSGIANAMDGKLAEQIGQTDWTESGESFSEALKGIFGSAEGEWSDPNSDKWAWLDNVPFVIAFRLIKALANSETMASFEQAASEWLRGAFDPWSDGFSWIDNMPFMILGRLVRAFTTGDFSALLSPAGMEIIQGFVDGMNQFELDAAQWMRDHVIDPVKRILGIASPSTVFKDIGRNIVQGLIDGVAGAWDTFSTFIREKLGNLIDNLSWENLLKLMSGEMSLSDLFAGDSTTTPSVISTGTVGGGIGTGPAPGSSTLTGSGSVVNNFYAPVYFGDMSSIGYDCPSPHPLLTASGQSLLPSGIGGT